MPVAPKGMSGGFSFIKQKVKSEDDYSYIEKLARPKKPFKEYTHFLPCDDNECVFSPDIKETQRKVHTHGKFKERYKTYVNTFKKNKKLTKPPDPECTHTPNVNLGKYADVVKERGELVSRMTQDAKSRKKNLANLQKEKAASIPSGQPKVEVSRAQTQKIIAKKPNLRKPFLKRVSDDCDDREMKQIIRTERENNPPELTFKPTLEAVGAEDVPERYGSFAERMAADTKRREQKFMYRAKLFGLPLPRQRKQAGADARPRKAKAGTRRRAKTHK